MEYIFDCIFFTVVEKKIVRLMIDRQLAGFAGGGSRDCGDLRKSLYTERILGNINWVGGEALG